MICLVFNLLQFHVGVMGIATCCRYTFGQTDEIRFGTFERGLLVLIGSALEIAGGI